MMLAPEEVYLKKRTVVSLETRTYAKGRAGRVISLGIGIVCISFRAHLLRTSCFIRTFLDLFSFQIIPNPDFAHLDSDKITQHFHMLLFDIVHQVGVSRF